MAGDARWIEQVSAAVKAGLLFIGEGADGRNFDGFSGPGKAFADGVNSLSESVSFIITEFEGEEFRRFLLQFERARRLTADSKSRKVPLRSSRNEP